MQSPSGRGCWLQEASSCPWVMLAAGASRMGTLSDICLLSAAGTAGSNTRAGAFNHNQHRQSQHQIQQHLSRAGDLYLSIKDSFKQATRAQKQCRNTMLQSLGI
ncbi:unnamed protein product [Gadus morhua 'NCC']